MNETEQQLDRINPLMLHNILVAVRRFEPDFYAYLCRTYHLDADRILGLFSSIEEIGAGQLLPILRDLRAHQAYHDITYLAGRNSLMMAVEHYKIKLKGGSKPEARFVSLSKVLLQLFLGNAGLTLMLHGKLHFVEIANSIFARGIQHSHSTCGFYSGLLAELGAGITGETCTAIEVRCIASDPEATTCSFQVAL